MNVYKRLKTGCLHTYCGFACSALVFVQSCFYIKVVFTSDQCQEQFWVLFYGGYDELGKEQAEIILKI